MPKTLKERAVFALFALVLAGALIAGLVWAWSSYASRPPLDVVINWAPAIVVSLGWLIYICLKPPRAQS